MTKKHFHPHFMEEQHSRRTVELVTLFPSYLIYKIRIIFNKLFQHIFQSLVQMAMQLH